MHKLQPVLKKWYVSTTHLKGCEHFSPLGPLANFLDDSRGRWAPKPNAGPHKLRECLPLIVGVSTVHRLLAAHIDFNVAIILCNFIDGVSQYINDMGIHMLDTCYTCHHRCIDFLFVKLCFLVFEHHHLCSSFFNMIYYILKAQIPSVNLPPLRSKHIPIGLDQCTPCFSLYMYSEIKPICCLIMFVKCVCVLCFGQVANLFLKFYLRCLFVHIVARKMLPLKDLRSDTAKVRK